MSEFHIDTEINEFQKLPWNSPLSEWESISTYVEDAPRGLSRHPIVFVNFSGTLFAIKELPISIVEAEYFFLKHMVELRLPVVMPMGYVKLDLTRGESGFLITRYLDSSLPYRSLFYQSGLERYRKHLLDAMASLLVQLHLAGIYWGDCSLSNTLFRRDAGALQAYLVDAETVETFEGEVPPLKRSYDLEIMEDNITGDLIDLEKMKKILIGLPISDIAAYIRVRYQDLWQEIKREVYVKPEEQYLIQDRIRALNTLGFSVGGINLIEKEKGQLISIKVIVTDRNYYRNELYSFTGIDSQEMQARRIMNEIYEIRAKLSSENNRSVPLNVAAYHWMENYYHPTIDQLTLANGLGEDPTESYCQILEHKWFLSERAKHDVGHIIATEDYIRLQTNGYEQQ